MRTIIMDREKMLSLEEMKDLKNINFQEIGNIYETHAENIKPELRNNYFIDEELLEENITELTTDLDDIIDQDDYNCCDFDKEYVQDIIDHIIVTNNHYLVVAYGYNWLKQDGIKFVNNNYDIFFDRNYDVSQTLQGATKGHKAILFTEYHHDNPTGAEMLAVSLTDKEYETLQNKNIDDIISWASQYKEKIEFVK